MLGGEELTEETANMDDPAEARAVADGYRYQYEVGAYAMLQSTRPQSLAYALTDSPVGLYSGVRLQGAFERTASRLIEMQSAEYLATPHKA